ncbi:MarR family winged helix-turn-helix transcriptional regulator, partial [Subtercola boreus]
MPHQAQFTTADIDAVIGWTVIRAARRATRLLAAALTEHSLTPVEFGVLVQLAAADEELSQADIARAVEMRPQSVAPTIDALITRGYLTREGPRGSGRTSRLKLAPAGNSVVEASFQNVSATNAAFTNDAAPTMALNSALLTFL